MLLQFLIFLEVVIPGHERGDMILLIHENLEKLEHTCIQHLQLNPSSIVYDNS